MERFIPSLIFLVLVIMAITILVIRALRSRPVTGQEGFIGMEGVAISDIVPEGRVKIKGEIWNATADETIVAASKVVVVEMIGLMVKVREVDKKIS